MLYYDWSGLFVGEFLLGLAHSFSSLWVSPSPEDESRPEAGGALPISQPALRLSPAYSTA